VDVADNGRCDEDIDVLTAGVGYAYVGRPFTATASNLTYMVHIVTTLIQRHYRVERIWKDAVVAYSRR
jgi:hypothetical protein